MKFYYVLSASFLVAPSHAADDVPAISKRRNRFVARNGIREDKREMHKQRKLQALDALDINMSIETVYKAPRSVNGRGAGGGANHGESADAKTSQPSQPSFNTIPNRVNTIPNNGANAVNAISNVVPIHKGSETQPDAIPDDSYNLRPALSDLASASVRFLATYTFLPNLLHIHRKDGSMSMPYNIVNYFGDKPAKKSKGSKGYESSNGYSKGSKGHESSNGYGYGYPGGLSGELQCTTYYASEDDILGRTTLFHNTGSGSSTSNDPYDSGYGLHSDESVQSVVKIYKDPDLDEKVGSFSEKRTFMMARSKNYHYDYLDEYNLCADLSLGLSSSMTGLRSITLVFQIFQNLPFSEENEIPVLGGTGQFLGAVGTVGTVKFSEYGDDSWYYDDDDNS
ncbi:hypothetical protein THAOC_01777 [Thalassiosira oceanica]|uniref:Jacalin-type lectin domain-containing protein n=1 Tax=Thalassiosira oceanica TaxID=159749 RepID=K0TMR8_THAOC|nr:hypothetical protein THAOC_01777 [Thalassiosira oceanica]|eukprot:EJK76461.1 hypothetical protein THAOC_01777 [Thalassiosira oceanica]